MVDAFELIGLPALLVGSAGQILHVNTLAQTAIGVRLAIQADHLVAADPAQNDMLSRLISGVLANPLDGTPSAWTHMTLTESADRPPLTIHARRVAGGSRAQLLQAVLVIDDGSSAVAAALADRPVGKRQGSPRFPAQSEKTVDDSDSAN